MSQVAGRMAIQAGATALEKVHGGRGVLLGGVPGVMPAKVAVIGGGVVGFNAAQMAAGLGADVTILERNRSEEHTSELQSLMRISYAVFCLKIKPPLSYAKH